MRRPTRKIILAAVVLAVVVAAAMWLTQEEPIPVTVEPVERGKVEETVVNIRAGTVKACRRANLATGVGGQVVTLPIEEGDDVEAGQLLLELWHDELSAELRLAKDEAAATRARGREVCLRAEVAQREADRLLALQRKGLAAEEAVDKAVTDAKAQEAACLAAQTEVVVSNTRISVLQARLEQYILRAPFAGSVAQINAEVGEYVTPSPPGIPTPPAVDLIDRSCLYVLAPIDEVDAPEIETGMDVRITLDAFQGRHFPGEVTRVADYVSVQEEQARTVDVEAEFLRRDSQVALLPGYSADLEIVLDVRTDTLRVPTRAVIDDERVLIYRPEEQTLAERPVETGLSNWEVTEIISGLQAGEQVVISVEREGVGPGAYVEPEAPLPQQAPSS